MPLLLRPSLAGLAFLGGFVALVTALSSPASPQPPVSNGNAVSHGPSGWLSEIRRVFLTRRPRWSTSAAWSRDNELLIVDQVYNKVLRYSRSGQALGTLPDSVETSLEDFFPAGVRARGTGLLFQLTTHHLVSVDQNYLPLARQDFRAEATNRLSAKSLWQWEPIGNDIISFSDINTGDPNKIEDTREVAYLRFPFDAPSSATVLEKFPLDHPLRLYNRLGFPYIAVLGDRAYILRVDELRIYVEDHGSLRATPIVLPDAKVAPHLPLFYYPADIKPVMAAVESSTMPTGLYAWHDALYVVMRVANGNMSQWKVVKIDPLSSEVVGEAVVSTSASHLLVVPGEKDWAFVEKGPVRGWGDQSIDSILFVPAARLAQPSGELSD